ncbi:MAG: hypothetical protein K6B40_03800 [Firmicutes bacterium]|nr:hypothetical protein [Bacillota bacterium]
MKIYWLRKTEAHFQANCSLYAAAAALLFLGFLFGLAAPVTMDGASAAAVKGYIGNYLQTLPGGDFDKSAELLRALACNGVLALLIWAFGLHVLGLAGIAAVLVYKGFGLGYAAGFLLNYQGLAGASVILFGILPQNVIFVLLLAYLAVAAARQSLRLWGRDFPRAALENLLSYGKALLRAAAALLLGAALQGYICPVFLHMLYVLL